MKSVHLLSIAAVVASVSAEGGYSSNPSGSTEQNKATQDFLDHLNKNLAENYLYALIVCTALVFIYHTSSRINSHIRHLTSLNGNPGSQVYFSTHSPWLARLKDHLLFAPLFHHRRASPVKFSRRINIGGLPARFQTIFIAAVVIYNIFACVWNVPWKNPQLEVLPILRNRCGTIATVNLIPIVIMSTIKNPLINILEISYDSFNLMHRWLGRVAILQGIAHMLCWIIAKVQQYGWKAVHESVTKSSFIYCGLIAVIGFTTLGIQAVKLWRALAYEVFLHSHIALVAMTFGGLWHHLEDFPQGKYLLAAIILWGGARLWRFSTIFWRSIGWGTSRGNAVAVVEPLPGDAMRVEFTLPRPFKATAGQSIYLCIPSVGFWTSHPFSLAWSESYFHGNLSRSTSTKTTKAFGADPEKSSGVVKQRGLDLEALGHHPDNQTFSLVIKKHDGFTKKLYERAIQQPPNVPLSLSALVEGPYGHQKSFSSYGTVLLFASGVGITHQMPYIRALVDQYALGTTATKRITLVWVVPTMDCLEWVRPWMHEILYMERRREILQCRLYITRATLSQDVKSPSETVRMSRGRPNVLEIMVNEARERVGCLGVSVCAGGGLADEVRRACRYVVGQGVALDFIEEGFGW